MDPKLLLVKVITLLFRESQIPERSENSSGLAKTIIASIKLPEATLDTDKGRETLIGLRSTALWMADNPWSYEYDKTDLLQRIRVNVGDDQNLYEAVLDGFVDLEELGRVKKQCITIRETLSTHLRHAEVREILKKASQKVLFSEEQIDWNVFVSETVAELEKHIGASSENDIPGLVDGVDFNNIASLEEMLNKAADEISADGVMRIGIQAINRMLGENEGFLRGEAWVVGALQHNFKTGFMLTILKGLAMYNTPYMRDPTKKPVILFVTLENSVTQNVLWLYSSLKENETGQACDIRNISIGEAASYLKEKFSATGYQIDMKRFNPTEFGYRDLFNYVMGWEANGFEVHALIVDYLNMASKTGCAQGPAGTEIRDLFRRVRNFTAPRGILFITPHQLSTEAKGLVRQGTTDFVKEIANKGYYDSCRTIDQEVDGEIYIHIEKKSGESFLTVQRGKHRKPKITREEFLYTVLPFSPIGAIRDDINGTDLSMKKVHGGGAGDDWWVPPQ